MDSSWESALLMLVVLAGLAAPGCSFQIVEGPSNATVVAGGQARFNCTVSQGWRLIMWALNSTVVLSITPKEPIITNDRFTSASYQAGADFVSEMLIQDVRPVDAGRVTCSLQSSDRVAWAFLSVQESSGSTDASLPTWAIALLTVAFSLLLILTIALIIVCCCCTSRRESKESTYQDEIRRSAAVKAIEASETASKGGRENRGYSTEQPGPSEAASSAPPTSGASTLPQGRHGGRPAAQSPDPHPRPGPASRPHVSFFTTSPRTVRSATLV